MLAVEHAQPIHRKKSIFRRFARKEPSELLCTPPTPPSPQSSIDSQPRSPRKLQRRASASLPTPPESPRQHQHILKSDIGKPQTITHIQHAQIPPKPQHARHDSAHDEPPSSASRRRVLPGAMSSLPFSSTPSITPWDIFLPPSHVHPLYLGHLPKTLSDKWFIYSEGPDTLGKLKVHFHRSWTGMKIAELFVVMDVRGEGAGKILGIKWNSGWETNRMSASEAKFAVRGAVVEMGVELEEEN